MHHHKAVCLLGATALPGEGGEGASCPRDLKATLEDVLVVLLPPPDSTLLAVRHSVEGDDPC